MDRRGHLPNHITVGARESPLSKVQVEEVIQSLRHLSHGYTFDTLFIKTTGDFDTKTPLWNVTASDFFTDQIDQMLLQGRIRIAIHSAKDLPQPLHPNLALLALTKSIDARDSLIMRPGETLPSLKPSASVGTSSLRRTQMISLLRKDLVPVSIRGTIHDRLHQLSTGKVDALIMAQAALIRLHLLHLNHIPLDFATEPLQGSLAIVGRKDDTEMPPLFHTISILPCPVYS